MMKITIHRGTDQIGGCVTEYEHNGYRLFVDYGEQLPGAKNTEPLEIEGLTKGDLSRSALLITHYHGDHIGCINKIPYEVPVYIGKVGHKIQMVLSEHLSYVDAMQKEIIDRLKAAKPITTGRPFSFKPFRIMPVTIDHSAFDAYAFKIEAGGVSVFHTGDFRTHGFRSGKLAETLERYVGQVDYMVCEGTNVSRPDATSMSERELQKEFEKQFRRNKGSVVYVSSTNIDRIFALYHAALRTGRKFLVDRYQKRIMDIVVKQEHIWSKAPLYRYGKENPMRLMYQYANGEFLLTDKFKDLLNRRGYVLIARANPRFDNLIARISGDKKNYLSMWEGYVKEGTEAYNEQLAASLSDGYVPMHTSGHCDMNSMRKFFRMLQPKGIVPIHTDKPEEFAKLFSDEFHVIRLHDGQSLTMTSKDYTDHWGVTYSGDGRELKHIDYERFRCEEYAIPEGVEEIGFAFMGVEGKHLRKIHLPSTLRHMVGNTFIDCPIEELVLPEGLTEIPGCMCECCCELKKVVLPSTLKRIGNAAFCHCKKLTDIVLPEGLEEILDDAFACCESLKILELPASIKYVGHEAFFGSGVEHLSVYEEKYENDEGLTSV